METTNRKPGKKTVKVDVIGGVPPPVMSLMLAGWQELVAAGHWTQGSGLLFNYDQQVFWIEVDEVPASVLVIELHHHVKRAWVSLGYTAPEHRRQGLYRLLDQQARAGALEKGMYSIAGGHSSANTVMLEVSKKLGRYERTVITARELPKMEGR